MEDAVIAFRELLLKTKALPVIFAGSGLSKRYLGAPNWDDLLKHFAAKNGRSLAYYMSKSKANPGFEQPDIATMITDVLFKTAGILTSIKNQERIFL